MTGIFYGSTTGNTETYAQTIASALGTADVFNVADASADDVEKYDLILLGSSTWGDGDLQDDWYDFLDALKGKNLAGKKVALFGTGDSASYPDTFCGALGTIYDDLQATGATFVGAFEPQGYDVVDSPVARDGKFVGLALDDNNSDNDERIAEWVKTL